MEKFSRYCLAYNLFQMWKRCTMTKIIAPAFLIFSICYFYLGNRWTASSRNIDIRIGYIIPGQPNQLVFMLPEAYLALKRTGPLFSLPSLQHIGAGNPSLRVFRPSPLFPVHVWLPLSTQAHVCASICFPHLSRSKLFQCQLPRELSTKINIDILAFGYSLGLRTTGQTSNQVYVWRPLVCPETIRPLFSFSSIPLE